MDPTIKFSSVNLKLVYDRVVEYARQHDEKLTLLHNELVFLRDYKKDVEEQLDEVYIQNFDAVSSDDDGLGSGDENEDNGRELDQSDADTSDTEPSNPLSPPSSPQPSSSFATAASSDSNTTGDKRDDVKTGNNEDNNIGDKHNVSLRKRRRSDSDTDSDQSNYKKTRS
jgi:hypothetical protein